jgi:hypothetical protein
MPTSFSFPVWEDQYGQPKQFKAKMLSIFPLNMKGKYFQRQAEAVFEYDGVKGVGIAELGIHPEKYGLDIND